MANEIERLIRYWERTMPNSPFDPNQKYKKKQS